MCPIVASDSLHQIARSFRMLGRLPWCVVMAGLVAGLLTFSQCAAAADDATAGIEYFEKHVRPLLVQHCYECHAGDERQGGLRLDYRDGLILGGDSGPAIEPGKPETSRIVEAVSYTNTDLQMPPKTRLGTEQVEVLRRWVAMGAPDPRSEPVVSNPSSTAPAASGMSIEDGREFWSFKPVTNPTVPTVKQRDWVQTPIDAFILAQLEKEGLEPAARADKRTLLRRITFDLIGLPPTPTEMADFLADDSPDAYERVVKRLLDSPEYGVRWGRHWLDVARYADSNGLDENLALGTAWKYRDYVIDAFNRDKPFDRFVIEQLAGDLLPDASRETKTATGFLVLGAKVLAEPDRDKLFMDTIDEQLDTIGKAFMGMTLGCVRCHDHKFDPLKQTDYYALAAIFKSTKTFGDTNFGAIKHWHEHVFASGEELQQIKKIDAEIAEKQKVATTYKNEAYAKIRAAARAQVADYLAAAAQFKFGASLAEMEPVAQQYGLHPRILYQCRRHLELIAKTLCLLHGISLLRRVKRMRLRIIIEPCLPVQSKRWQRPSRKILRRSNRPMQRSPLPWPR